MSVKTMRYAIFFLILAILCAGAICSFRTADYNIEHPNAVLVMATQ